MKIKYVYLILCVFGFILPYSQLIPILLEGSFSMELMIDELFATRMTSLFILDLFVTAMVYIVFAIHEGLKMHMKKLYLPLIATFLVGASFGFPLFLYMREITLEKQHKEI